MCGLADGPFARARYEPTFQTASKPLPAEFYARGTVEVARELLGKILIVRSPGGSGSRRREVSARIIETEAYHGEDPASHSARGETPRCAPMFGEPGRAYVYFIYGNYEMLNFVTEREGYPGAVLIRAVEPLTGEDLVQRRRKGQPRSHWTNGPGRLCRALGIRMSDNGLSLQGPRMEVGDDGWRPAQILASPRVGISRATGRFWRFWVADSPFVSKAPQNSQAIPVRKR